jgi:hypothetical protein
MFSFIEIIGNLSQALMAIAAGFRKVLYLRTAFAISAIMEVIYYFFVAAKPIWTPIFWSSALFFINIYFILRILYEKKFLSFSADELTVYDLIGKKIDITHFKKLMRAGTWVLRKDSQDILQENVHNDRLYFLVEGEATVLINNIAVTKIHKGNFIGEMSFLTGNKTSAGVSVSAGSKYIYWENKKLEHLLGKDISLKHDFHNLISSDLVLKMIRNNKRSIPDDIQ